jgi:glycosyltransferase involved in cell wall biosynthesis
MIALIGACCTGSPFEKAGQSHVRVINLCLQKGLCSIRTHSSVNPVLAHSPFPKIIPRVLSHIGTDISFQKANVLVMSKLLLDLNPDKTYVAEEFIPFFEMVSSHLASCGAKLEIKALSKLDTSIVFTDNKEDQPSDPELKDAFRRISSGLGPIFDSNLKAIFYESSKPFATQMNKSDLIKFCRCIELNERYVRRILDFPRALKLNTPWVIDGPFHGAYSLAQLNRELAIALLNSGKSVYSRLHSMASTISELQIVSGNLAEIAKDISEIPESRIEASNNYPPDTFHLDGGLKILHSYAWEESEFPQNYVAEFNSFLDGISVVSEHTKKILIDAGVCLPIEVTGMGLGEHFLNSNWSPRTSGEVITFLHVSSFFPRKGGDVLLRAFFTAFSSKDKVKLVIKTFPNPHNKIVEMLGELGREFPDPPQIEVINREIQDSELLKIYEIADVVVIPSRAEGFGLPIGEAVALGIPVITTGWSGQLTMSDIPGITFIDYDFARSTSHMNLKNSVWAEPSHKQLVEELKYASKNLSKLRSQADAGRLIVKQNLTWASVSSRIEKFIGSLGQQEAPREPIIGIVSTWNARCGIAEYARDLYGDSNEDNVIFAEVGGELAQQDKSNVIRCWSKLDNASIDGLLDKIVQNKVDVVSIQFNWEFFSAFALRKLLTGLRTFGISVTVTLHSTIPYGGGKLEDYQDALSKVDRVFVHSLFDLNRLKDLGLVDNVTLFPHGINMIEPENRSSNARRSSILQLATFGFFVPHKGLLEIIEAVYVLRQKGMAFHLNMFNAKYPSLESEVAISQAKTLIEELDLSEQITISTEFLSAESALQKLSTMDLVIYPYQETGESASGAVRFGLGSGVPVAVTPLNIFEDVSDFVDFLPGVTPEEIASGIIQIIEEFRQGTSRFDDRRSDMGAYSFENLGPRFNRILRSIHLNKAFASKPN